MRQAVVQRWTKDDPRNKTNAAKEFAKSVEAEITEPGKCIFHRDKFWEGFLEPETHGQDSEGVFKGKGSGVQTHMSA